MEIIVTLSFILLLNVRSDNCKFICNMPISLIPTVSFLLVVSNLKGDHFAKAFICNTTFSLINSLVVYSTVITLFLPLIFNPPVRVLPLKLIYLIYLNKLPFESSLK